MTDKLQHPAQATYDANIQLHQDAFLAAYADSGTIASAAQAAGFTASCVYDWKKADRFGFLDRFSEAQGTFGEKLEYMALKRVENLDPKAKGGSDILLIAMLNANKPDKWRRGDAPVVGSGAPAITQIIIHLPGASNTEMVLSEGPVMVVDGKAKLVPDEAGESEASSDPRLES